MKDILFHFHTNFTSYFFNFWEINNLKWTKTSVMDFSQEQSDLFNLEIDLEQFNGDNLPIALFQEIETGLQQN